MLQVLDLTNLVITDTEQIMGGMQSDLFAPAQRGHGIALMSLIPLLGPAFGPLAASAILFRLSWRYIFHITSALDALFIVMAFFLLRETYAPTLLTRKVKFMRQETGKAALRSVYDEPSEESKLWTKLSSSYRRSWKMLMAQPIVVAVRLYVAWSFGCLYIFLSMFPEVWRILYRQTVLLGGLHYIGKRTEPLGMLFRVNRFPY